MAKQRIQKRSLDAEKAALESSLRAKEQCYFSMNGTATTLPDPDFVVPKLDSRVKLIPINYRDIGQRHRAALEEKYREQFQLRLEARQMVTYVPNKSIPVYNWFKFKEGFSRQLVVELASQFGLKAGEVVLDPFAGCGTTLLAAKEMGFNGLGIDVLPTSVFVAQVKLRDWPSIDDLLRSVQKLMDLPYRKPTQTWPDVKIVNLAFTPDVQEQLLFFKEEIEKFAQPFQDFLLLGLLSILESVSRTSKDGQFLRLVEKEIPPVKDALRAVLSTMISDLSKRTPPVKKIKPGKVSVVQGDARDPADFAKVKGKVAAVITSPPYLNRYDYSRTYALELCLIAARSHKDMVRIRHSLLRSHVESKEHQERAIELPSLDEILLELNRKDLNNNRVPIMVKGYFEDMNMVIKNIAESLKPGGQCALVVANAQFAGENVPVDLMLSELAETHGLTTEEIWITRYKGNSSQQMAIYGRRPVRESVVFWRKNV